MKNSEIILYTSLEGQVKVDVFLQDETVWLTQKRMADLFGVEVNTVNYHIKEIFKAGELAEKATIRKFRIVQKEGSREVGRETDFFNLDMIIAVGYRVNSRQATQFRIWATKVLKEYMIKGFALDDNRLKNGIIPGKSYFDELLERIRDIRSSERVFYQKITDIYAQCSMDYDSDSDITHKFYATVQNKLHWAIHHHTAAELIVKRADAAKPHMGLTTWKNAPSGKIRKTDAIVAKNYLNEVELKKLNRIVSMYLDYAEEQAEKGRPMTMTDWVAKLDAFLQFNEKEVLSNPGKVSAELAKKLAEEEFGKFEEARKAMEASQPVSDFDKLIEKSKLIDKKDIKKGKDND